MISAERTSGEYGCLDLPVHRQATGGVQRRRLLRGPYDTGHGLLSRKLFTRSTNKLYYYDGVETAAAARTSCIICDYRGMGSRRSFRPHDYSMPTCVVSPRPSCIISNVVVMTCTRARRKQYKGRKTSPRTGVEAGPVQPEGRGRVNPTGRYIHDVVVGRRESIDIVVNYDRGFLEDRGRSPHTLFNKASCNAHVKICRKRIPSISSAAFIICACSIRARSGDDRITMCTYIYRDDDGLG